MPVISNHNWIFRYAQDDERDAKQILHHKRSPSFIKEGFPLDKGDTAKPRGFENLEKTDLFKIGSSLYYMIN